MSAEPAPIPKVAAPHACGGENCYFCDWSNPLLAFVFMESFPDDATIRDFMYLPVVKTISNAKSAATITNPINPPTGAPALRTSTPMYRDADANAPSAAKTVRNRRIPSRKTVWFAGGSLSKPNLERRNFIQEGNCSSATTRPHTAAIKSPVRAPTRVQADASISGICFPQIEYVGAKHGVV